MKAGDEEVGAEALLLLGTARQEVRNDISYGVASGAVDQASRAWLQLLGHIMGTGDDAAQIDQLLTAAEAAAASVNAAVDNPVLLHLRTLHVLLRQHGAPAAAAAAAALLAACGASQATCSACGRACLTTSKVEADSKFTCESPVALFPRVSCPSPASAAVTTAPTQPASSAEPKRRRTGNGVKVEEAAAVPPAAKVEAVLATETGAGPHAPVTPVSEAAPVPVNAVKQSREALAGHAAAAPVPFEQPPASGAPVTRATRSKARRAQKEGMKAQDAAQESPAAPPAVSAGAETPLPAAASPDSRPARAVSGSISQAAIGTAQPLLIRIKQDTGESGGGQQQPAMPIIPLSTSAAGDAGSGTPSKDALAASPAPGGGGAAGAQLRRSGRSARKDGKAAGSGSSSPATTPPPPPAPAAPGGVSRTVTSLSHGGRPTGPAISSPRDLQIALSPYRAVITSGNAPIPPGRRVQKASSDTALGRRGGTTTRSSTTPLAAAVSDGALALLQSAAEQAYRRTASDPTNYASASAAAAAAAIAAEQRPKQTVSTGAALPPIGAPRPPPSNTVSTGAAPPAATMDAVAAALGLIPDLVAAAQPDSVPAPADAADSGPAESPAVAAVQETLAQLAAQAAADPAAGETASTAAPADLPPVSTAERPEDASVVEPGANVIADTTTVPMAVEGAEQDDAGTPAGKAGPDVLQTEV